MTSKARVSFSLYSDAATVVQVRQTQVGKLPVSVQTAVAVSISSDRVGIYLTCPSDSPVRAPRPSTAPLSGQRVQGFIVAPPDGSGATGDPDGTHAGCSHELHVNGLVSSIGIGESITLPNGGQVERGTALRFRQLLRGQSTEPRSLCTFRKWSLSAGDPNGNRGVSSSHEFRQ